MPRNTADKKAERLLHLIGVLNSGEGYSGPDLAEIMGVSLRTVYRDVVVLSTLVPIYYDQGYRLLADSQIANLAFTRDELLALALGMGTPALVAASHLSGATLSALNKVREQLNRRFGERNGADDAVSIHVEAYKPSIAMVRTLRVLEETINNHHRVELVYQTPLREKETVRAIDPYGLTFRIHTWYLVGFCHLRKCERVFRVDRITAVKPLPDRFERPASFSIEEFFADSWEVYVPSAKARARIKFHWDLETNVKPRLNGWGDFHGGNGKPVVFEGEVPISEEFCRWLLKFGGDAEVLEPPALREMIAAKIAEAARVYGVAPDPPRENTK